MLFSNTLHLTLSSCYRELHKGWFKQYFLRFYLRFSKGKIKQDVDQNDFPENQIFLRFFKMWTIFKLFIEFVTKLLLVFMFWFFWPWGMWNQTHALCTEKWSLNHWTTRKVPENTKFIRNQNNKQSVLYIFHLGKT